MPSLTDAFASIDGAEPRVVATLEALDFRIEFMRDDLEETYSEADLERVYRSVMANQVSADDVRKIGGFGDLECQVFLFEEVVAFLFPSSRYESVFVSFDRERPFPLLDVVGTASDVPHLSGETDS